MGRQVAPRRIRRCRNCNFKTHRRFWENGRCPICGDGKGYIGSTHGGLTNKREIREERKRWRLREQSIVA